MNLNESLNKYCGLREKLSSLATAMKPLEERREKLIEACQEIEIEIERCSEAGAVLQTPEMKKLNLVVLTSKWDDGEVRLTEIYSPASD